MGQPDSGWLGVGSQGQALGSVARVSEGTYGGTMFPAQTRQPPAGLALHPAAVT